jgi:hypothetical protein
MRWLRWLFVVAFVVTAIAVPGWLLLSQVKICVGYGIRAGFTQFPRDDEALETWLAAQPGVVRVASCRDNGAIRVYWIMVRDVSGNPPAPDVRQAFERFGYRGLTSYDDNWTDN